MLFLLTYPLYAIGTLTFLTTFYSGCAVLLECKKYNIPLESIYKLNKIWQASLFQ